MTARTLADEAFGTDLFRLLAKDSPDLVFSPASVAAALRLALSGARGETAAELAAVLRIQPQAAVDGLRDLDALTAQTPADITFRVANTAWVQSGMPLQPDFTARLGAIPSSVITDADFAGQPERARSRINKAIEEQTAGKITNLLPPGAIGALTRLVLANALYLKAPWAHPFPGQATKDAPFHPGPDQNVTVPMMRGRANREYLRGDGYQAVLLSYRASRLAMAVVLPDGPLSTLAGRSLGELLAGAAEYQVTLSLPRFRVEADTNLAPVLRQLGISTAFTGDADFTGISSAEPLHIDAAVHKAYVDVDEQGTEAAAATAIGFAASAMRKPPPPAEMIVDRPFLFAIIDAGTGSALFLGQVTNPQQSRT
jgi:serpin B